MTSASSFNLVDEPWLPVVDLNGQMREVGLRELFVEAHRLRGLVDSSPLAEFSMLRLLWVLTHRIIKGPKTNEEWIAQWRRGQFDPAAVDAYFDAWRHRFDLFDDAWPFLQVGGLTTMSKGGNCEFASVAKLVPEHASKSNPTLFSHTTDRARLQVGPGEAARMLLTAQAYSFGGGKALASTSNHWAMMTHSNYEYAPCTGTISVFIERSILYETLSANLPLLSPKLRRPFESGPSDAPVWEQTSSPSPGPRTPEGYLVHRRRDALKHFAV